MINIGRNGKRNGGGMHSGVLGMGMGLHSDFTNSEREWEWIPKIPGMDRYLVSGIISSGANYKPVSFYFYNDAKNLFTFFATSTN